MNPGTHIAELEPEPRLVANGLLSAISALDYKNRLLVATALLKECIDWGEDEEEEEGEEWKRS